MSATRTVGGLIAGAVILCWALSFAYELGRENGLSAGFARDERDRWAYEVRMADQALLLARPTDEVCRDLLHDTAEQLIRDMIESGAEADIRDELYREYLSEMDYRIEAARNGR